MPGFQRSALQIGLAIFLAAFFVAILGAFLAALPASAANALEKKRGGDQCRVFNALLCKSGWQSFLLPFLWPFLAPFLPRYPLQRRMRPKQNTGQPSPPRRATRLPPILARSTGPAS